MKKTILVFFVSLVLISCKTTQGFSDDFYQTERNRIPSTNTIGCKFDIYWTKRKKTENGSDCPSRTDGICLKLATSLIGDDVPTCFVKNENDILSMVIPQYNYEQIVNPQYEMFDGLDALSISDSLVLWNEETLEALDFTTPIAVLPDDYRISRSHDTLYLDLQTSPVNLEKKVCAFFYYDNHTLQNVRFQDYYEGFLGESDILTGVVCEVEEEYIILAFYPEFNIGDALSEARHIIDNRIFQIAEDIVCNDHSICDILEISGSFLLLHGEYEIEPIDDWFVVKVPYVQ